MNKYTSFEQTDIHPICIDNHVEFCHYNAMPLDIKYKIIENTTEYRIKYMQILLIFFYTY